MSRWARWQTRRYLTGPPLAVDRVINAARLLHEGWTAHDVNLQYEATFDLLDAVLELEQGYGDILGPPRRR